MTKKSPIALAAILLLAGSASLTMLPNLAVAQSKENSAEAQAASKKEEFVRKEWVKLYAEIQTLISEKKFTEASAKLDVLAATENQTPYEQFFVTRNKAALASTMGNNTLLTASFEKLIASDFLSDEEKLRYTESLAGIYFQEKKYDLSKAWSLRYIEKNPNNAAIHDLLIRNYYLMNDFASAEKELKIQIAADDAAGRVPSLDRLRLLHSTYIKLNNQEGVITALERMVEHYPQKDFWGDLVYKLIGKKTFSERLRLDWYRLLKATDNMEDAGQYGEMAEISLLAGFPVEAKKILDDGFSAGFLGKGTNAAVHKSLLVKATKQAADDIKTLDASEASAKSAKTGLAMVNMGYNLSVNGFNDRAIALMEQGIAKGGLKYPNEAYLRLGMVYLESGNKEKAKETFSKITGNDGAADLAKYWLLLRK